MTKFIAFLLLFILIPIFPQEINLEEIQSKLIVTEKWPEIELLPEYNDIALKAVDEYKKQNRRYDIYIFNHMILLVITWVMVRIEYIEKTRTLGLMTTGFL